MTLTIRQSVLAGKACFTLQNTETSNRRTFKVTHAKKPGMENMYFISVLNGPDNESSYAYMGMLNIKRGTFRTTVAAKIRTDSVSFKTFAWFINLILNGKELPEQVKFFNAGRCFRCGKKLTTPESITLGYGAECIKLLERI